MYITVFERNSRKVDAIQQAKKETVTVTDETPPGFSYIQSLCLYCDSSTLLPVSSIETDSTIHYSLQPLPTYRHYTTQPKHTYSGRADASNNNMKTARLLNIATALFGVSIPIAANKTPPSSHSPSVMGECIPIGDQGINNNFHCLATTRNPAIPCKNEHTECDHWKSKDECRSNPGYMLYNCRKACETCIDIHVGTVQRLPAVQQLRTFIDLLISTQQYVYDEAIGKTSVYQKCVNKHELCTVWKMQGECESNPSFMHSSCPAVCQVCSGTY